jgi:hypothetical protein
MCDHLPVPGSPSHGLCSHMSLMNGVTPGARVEAVILANSSSLAIGGLLSS